MLRPPFAIFALLGALASPAAAEDIPRSECLAMANAPALMTPVSLRRVAAKADEIAITYAGHSTYFIDTPGGVRIATDYSGAYQIGRLDIVMVPIDGTYTMSLDGISDITRRPRASVVLPMHRFATPLEEFMRRIGQQFTIDVRTERSLRISRDSLPGSPTVIILDGV